MILLFAALPMWFSARVVAVCVIALAGALVPASLSAQQRSWWIVPTVVEGRTPLSDEWIEALGNELRQRNLQVFSGESARLRFEARESLAPSRVDPSLVATLPGRADEALVETASGRTPRAREIILPILDTAEDTADALLRDDPTATHVFNVCLYMVRALLWDSDEAGAADRALRCRRLVPDLVPDPHLHPPEVIVAFEREVARAEARGTMTIDSEPSGCVVRMNGRQLGVTPHMLRDKPAGEYRVQVECSGDPPARVHRVTLGSEDARAVVDPGFDRAVVTGRETFALSYRDENELRTHGVAHALLLGRSMHPAAVVLVRRDATTNQTLRLDRVDVARGGVVSAVLTREATVSETADALLREAGVDITTDTPQEITIEHAPPVAPPNVAVAAQSDIDQRSRTERKVTDAGRPSASAGAESRPGTWGFLFAGVGVAGLGASWFFWANLEAQNDDFAEQDDIGVPEFGERQQAVDNARPPPLIASIAGGGFATASLHWLLPRTDGVPWWSWVVGGVGLGIAAVGVWQLTQEGDYIDEGRTRRETPAIFGGMLLAHAAPLLAVPVIYLLRDVPGSREASVSFVLDGDVAAVRLDAAF